MATAPHGHQLDRALNAKTTLLCVLAGCLFPGEGHDGILRITFGMPGLDLEPGTPVPAGLALSKAMALLSEQVARRAFELDAAHADVDLGIGATWRLPPSTARRPSCSAMTCSPGSSACPRAARNPGPASSPMSAPGPAAGSARRPWVMWPGTGGYARAADEVGRALRALRALRAAAAVPGTCQRTGGCRQDDGYASQVVLPPLRGMRPPDPRGGTSQNAHMVSSAARSPPGLPF